MKRTEKEEKGTGQKRKRRGMRLADLSSSDRDNQTLREPLHQPQEKN